MLLRDSQMKEIIYFNNVKPSSGHSRWEFLLCFLCLSDKGKEGLKIAWLLVIRAMASPTILKHLPKCNLSLTVEFTCLGKLSF